MYTSTPWCRTSASRPASSRVPRRRSLPRRRVPSFPCPDRPSRVLPCGSRPSRERRAPLRAGLPDDRPGDRELLPELRSRVQESGNTPLFSSLHPGTSVRSGPKEHRTHCPVPKRGPRRPDPSALHLRLPGG